MVGMSFLGKQAQFVIKHVTFGVETEIKDGVLTIRQNITEGIMLTKKVSKIRCGIIKPLDYQKHIFLFVNLALLILLLIETVVLVTLLALILKILF